MKSAIAIAVALLTLAAPAFAQSAAALKRELRSRESAAKKEKTPDALCEVAAWASEKGMAAAAKRLYLNVLKIDPNHEAANFGLGNAQFDGKWMPKKKADDLRRKAQVAEYKAKGFVEVNGMWVEKEHAADAKAGIFHHEGKRISKEEKQALLDGMVYHPVTGLLIDAKHLQKAKEGQFPVGSEGRWADEKAADTYYSAFSHPWVVRSHHGTVMTTLPMAKILEIKTSIDRACERVGPLFGSAPPVHRPTIVAAATIDEYRELGNSFGDETSAASAFLMSGEARIRLPFQSPVRAGVCTAHQAAMTEYYARHAAGMAYAHSKSAEASAEPPLWFLNAVGSLAGFFENDRVGAHFCRTMVVVKGGVQNLKAFFNGFAINGDMAANDITYNWTMAGLMLHFAMMGGDSDTTDALVGVTKAYEQGKGVDRAIENLQKQLINAEGKIAAHMQKLMDANQ